LTRLVRAKLAQGPSMNLHNPFDPDRAAAVESAGSSALLERYLAVRAATERLAQPLSAEDQNLQSMPDASPAKWHRAHTSWFFETFILKQQSGYRDFDPAYSYLFNSYYE